MPLIAPSVLAADFGRLEEEIRLADATGIDMFHLDIMDGHFVPNISFGPAIVERIHRTTVTFLDVHLMLSNPTDFFEPFVKAGADNITFHIEVHPDPREQVKSLCALGVKAGISLNPRTPVETVLPYLELFDYLLIMSVQPGFGGQKFIESALDKIRQARAFIDRERLQVQIQVDGGVDMANSGSIVGAGADVLVMGSAYFGANDRLELVRRIHALR